VDVSLVIRQRLDELGRDQKDLATAVQVTESYISQLLTRKKAPPAPARTDLYERMGEYLEIPGGELSKLAELQRRQELKKKVAEPPQPLFQDSRRLILRKYAAGDQGEVRRIIEKEAFGELERLVTQKLLEVAQGVAREELRNECWLRSVGQEHGRSYEEMRVAVLEFLDTDIHQISTEGCVSFLDPMIETWSINLKTFAMTVVLNRRLAPGCTKRFEFTETSGAEEEMEPGLREFLNDTRLSGNATEEEVEFLRTLKVKGRRPSAMYYYRELQNLRDPLHFLEAGREGEQ